MNTKEKVSVCLGCIFLLFAFGGGIIALISNAVGFGFAMVICATAGILMIVVPIFEGIKDDSGTTTAKRTKKRQNNA